MSTRKTYTPKGICRTCKHGKPEGDCTERMFFLCASSEYKNNEKTPTEYPVIPWPDWWEPKENEQQ